MIARLSSIGASMSTAWTTSPATASFSMYTHGPGSNIAPRSATAMTASASGSALAVSVVPSTGSTAMSTSGRRAIADPLAVVEHRRLVLLALADDDDAVHGDRGQHGTHRIDRGLVDALLVAAPHETPGGDSRGLGDPHQLEREIAVGIARQIAWVGHDSSLPLDALGEGAAPPPRRISAQDSESNQSKVRVTAFFQNL